MTDTLAQKRSYQVAANIRAELGRRRMTQYALAQLIGMSPASMSARLKGQTPIDVNELERIAEILSIPMASLLEDAA